MSTNLNITIPELPLWMREARRGVDWGIIVIIALSMAIAWPFITQSGLPRTTTVRYSYIYRTQDTIQALQEGRLYPRWSPYALDGYGAPIPNYYPPGAPYTAALIDLLITDNPVQAIRIVIIVSMTLAGTLTYVFVARQAGAPAGVVAAMLYLYSPYVGLTAPVIIGDLAHIIQLALLPALFWSLSRLLHINRALDFTFVALISAGLLLTEAPSGIITLVLGLMFVLWEGVRNRRPRRTMLAILAMVCGVGIAAFYWLPAILEFNLVQWQSQNITVPKPMITLQTLFQPARQIDSGAMLPSPELTIGLIGTIFVLLNLLVLLRRRYRSSFHTLFLIQGMILTTLALVFFADKVWLLGQITFCTAITGSGIMGLREQLSERGQRLMLAIVTTVILIGSTPIWLGSSWNELWLDLTPEAQIDSEQNDFGIAVLPLDAAVPSTIASDLAPNRTLINSYRSDEKINRFPISQQIGNVQTGLVTSASHQYVLQMQIRENTTIGILNAYFPGWQATLAGDPVPVFRDSDTGLSQIRLNRPSNPNAFLTLMFWLGPTDTRSTAWAMSWLCLLLTAIITWRRSRQEDTPYDDIVYLTIGDARLVGAVLVFLLVAIIYLNNPSTPLTLRAQPRYQIDDMTRFTGLTDTGLRITGYRITQRDDTIQIDLLWETQRLLSNTYQIGVHLIDESVGADWFRSDPQIPGNYSTRYWSNNLYVKDTHTLTISESAPAGKYQIAVELYRCETTCNLNNRQQFFDTNATPLGEMLILPTLITIDR